MSPVFSFKCITSKIVFFFFFAVIVFVQNEGNCNSVNDARKATDQKKLPRFSSALRHPPLAVGGTVRPEVLKQPGCDVGETSDESDHSHNEEPNESGAGLQ